MEKVLILYLRRHIQSAGRDPEDEAPGPHAAASWSKVPGRYVEMDSDSNAAADIQPSFHLV